MGESRINLTDAEWNVMECLWEKSPRTGRETIDLLKERMGWSRSTTLTLLRRMEEKGAVGSETSGGCKVFYPMVSRESAALQETEDFLGRVYKGSLGMMLTAFTQKQNLSKEEIDELYAILKAAEEKNND
ncbi:MAG: BlaI/MecI/CopY family transcriptional regulator [Roseburia sp.]|nr:BlaI/MecI/CopY family transcriptional regulator [Roseburia sp.]